jgi:uncharacterized membrane protein YuzA (DUF378 family)
MAKGNWLDTTALVLVVVGAVNWGLFAFGFNLVDLIFGRIAVLATIVYVLVGLSGLYALKWFKK